MLFSPLDDASSTAQAIKTELISVQKLPRRFAVHNEAVINYEEKLTAEGQLQNTVFQNVFCDNTYFIALDILWLRAAFARLVRILKYMELPTETFGLITTCEEKENIKY